jgi:hypothetical protein
MAIIEKISKNRKEVRWMLYGALFFWTPDVLIHAIRRYSFDNIWLVAAVCPLTVIAGYFVVAHFSARKIAPLHSWLMILGIWCAGGLATMLASSLAGGGLASADGRWTVIAISLATVIFPPFTAMLATYDGTLWALLLGTLLLGMEAGTLSARVVQPRLGKATG